MKNRDLAVWSLSLCLGAGALLFPACNSDNVRTQAPATTMLNEDSTPTPSAETVSAAGPKHHSMGSKSESYTSAAPAQMTPTMEATPTLESASATPSTTPTAPSNGGHGWLWIMVLLAALIVGGLWAWPRIKKDDQ